MFLLKKPTALTDEYEKKMLSGLKKRIKSGREHNKIHKELSDDAKSILLPNWDKENPDESILKQLLISEPAVLKHLNGQTS